MNKHFHCCMYLNILTLICILVNCIVLFKERRHDRFNFSHNASNQTQTKDSEFNSVKASQSQCSKNVVLVKTHKTGASTIQNILFRYGLKRNLTFLLPKKDQNFRYPLPFSARFAIYSGIHRNHEFNIVCHHMRFVHAQVKKLMPNDTKYITVMREPGALFESTFTYMYDSVPAFQLLPSGDENAALRWLDSPHKYLRNAKPVVYNMFTQNHMAFDLGFDYKKDEKQYIARVIKEVKRVFDLVMIADYMDESLVLLSELLCVPLEEMYSIKIHMREKTSTDKTVHQKLRKKARLHNKTDTALFDYFNASLWARIEEYGFEKMTIQVEKLQKKNNQMQKRCIDDSTRNVSNITTPSTNWMHDMFQPSNAKLKHYILRKEYEHEQDCIFLTASPKGFTKFLRNHQKKAFRTI